MRRFLLVGAVASHVAGCVSLPQFDAARGVTPKTVVAVIECELIRVRNKIDAENKVSRDSGEAKNKALEDLHGWIAVADLALQVDEQAVLTPTLSHTGVVSKSFGSVFDWGAKLDTQAQRIYNQTVTFNITDLRDTCTSDTIGTGVALHGSLGLDEVLHMAFESANAKGISLGRSEDGNGDGKGNDEGASRDQAGGGAKKKVRKKKKPVARNQSAFGTTIEFAVVKAIGPGGPTWTLTNFKGAGKLFTVQRSDTHRVQISFGRDEDAAKRFNQSTTLQNLVTKRPSF